MQELSTVLTSLSIAAGLALGVERVLEVLKHIMDMEGDFLHGRDRQLAVKGTEDAIQKAEKAFQDINNPSKIAQENGLVPGTSIEAINPGSTDSSATDSEANESYPAASMHVTPVTVQSSFAVRKALFLQLAALGMGIVFAYIFDLGLLSKFLVPLSSSGVGDATVIGLNNINHTLDIVLTGLVVGGGSQPIHVLIRFLTERKLTVNEVKQLPPTVTSDEKSTTVIKESPVLVDDFKWKDIDYNGGVKKEILENVHRRPGEPNLIVYHHTAMSSSASFQDIVDEFLVTKQWLTGYHCVIMPNGNIRPFCRWDRTGNHAKGKNSRSLGISFHGNFHTKPDKFSNASGRYGNQSPTEAQLRAGARVVALWVYLYKDIELDFERCILSHKEAMPPGYTVCPGSNFPCDKPNEVFQNLIRQYHAAWAESEHAQNRIKELKNRPYIYAL